MLMPLQPFCAPHVAQSSQRLCVLLLLASLTVACKKDGPTTLPVDDATVESDESPPASTPLQTVSIATDAWTFDARAAGPEDGELVILLHGFPQTSYQWRHALRALGEAGYRAVAPDQRGYSPQARPTEVADYAVTALVYDVLAMADALGHERFHVVGHDWGAVVTWVMGALATQRVLSITAVSTAHPALVSQHRATEGSCQREATAHYASRKLPEAAGELLADDAAELRAHYGDLPPDAVDAYLRVLGTEAALNAALNWYRANIDPPMPPAPLGPARVPTLYVWSDADPYNCRDTAEANAAFVDAPYTFKIVEDADHWLPERAPQIFADALLQHLSANRAPSP